jgi:hypothetical protein
VRALRPVRIRRLGANGPEDPGFGHTNGQGGGRRGVAHRDRASAKLAVQGGLPVIGIHPGPVGLPLPDSGWCAARRS